MVIDIFTMQKFTREEFEQISGYNSARDLFLGRQKHYKSRFILEEKFNSLVKILVDEKDNEYFLIVPSSMEFYFNNLTSNEKSGLGLVSLDKICSTTIRGVKLTKKNPCLEKLEEFSQKRKSTYNPDAHKSYFSKTKDGKRIVGKKWAEKNPDKIKKYRNKYESFRRDNDLNFKLRKSLRNRIRLVLNGSQKSQSTQELLGCDISFLKSYLETQFQEGMTWENYGFYGWHIDHIKPCASFDLTDPEQQKQCFHYLNLQPLWAKDNLSKGDKYNP